MPDAATPQFAPEALLDIDDSCDAFERLWQQGHRPNIADHLLSVKEALQPLLVEELIRTELEWRCRAGESPTVEEYRSRYPGCSDSIPAWLDEAISAALSALQGADSDTHPGEVPRTLTHDGGRPTDVAGQPPAPLSPVLRVLGEYQLLEKLGAGGMGEVWKARHRRLVKLVALKLLLPRPEHSEAAVARFVREMRAAGSVDHPNVVESNDAGEHEGTVYLVMKLVEGKDLTKLVRERGPLPVAEACDIARQVALGLGHLAERGLVHRDIKPSNLMRTPEGVVKILDLGLARWRAEHPAGEDLTGDGQTLGTPDYLAPEQLDRAPTVDIRADMYGLGGTLYFLLTGQAPFAHRHGLFPKLEAARREVPADVRTLRPEVPEALAKLVARLLAKRPGDRPQTPADVATALEAFAGNPGTTPPTTLTWINSPRRRARRRWRMVVGLGLVVLVGIGVWRFTSPSSRQVYAGEGDDVVRTPDGGGRVDDVQKAAHPSGKGEGQVSTGPLRVIRLDVLHVANLQGKGQARGVMGKKSFAAHRGDGVTVEAVLSRPAYAYLIAFRPDGTVDLCFPERADELPPLTDRPRFPSASQELEYGLDEGEGLEVFAVVASDKPLPPYKQWRSAHGHMPWKRVTSPAGVVWSYVGSVVQGLTATSEQRGPREAEGQAPVVKLAKWLAAEGEGLSVAALGFVVLPKQQP